MPKRSILNKVSDISYGGARYARDMRCIEKCIKTGSFKPLLKRIVNKLIGRTIVSKLWWR